MPQDFGVYPNLNAVEFLEYLAAIKGVAAHAARRRIAALLELVNLTEVRKRPLAGYSGGMRQRLGIAQALLNDPQLLIVDEPTVGLDPEERARFRHLLTDLAGERIVILSTHIVTDVEAAATELVLIHRGQLLLHTTPEHLLRTGVGQIIAATPISRAHYLFGKCFSNFAVLSTIVGVLVLVAAGMQFLRGEETQLRLWPLLSPFILMTLPAMLVIAALALLFESVSWLRGGLGNALYFFLWIALLSTAIMPSMIQHSETVTPAHDLFGMSTLLADMSRAVRQHFPEYKESVSVGYEIRRGPIRLQTFPWQGMALAAGTCSGSPKLFEVIYVMWWYVGPINRVAPLDFVGATVAATPQALTPPYLMATAILLIVAYCGRRRQIRA